MKKVLSLCGIIGMLVLSPTVFAYATYQNFDNSTKGVIRTNLRLYSDTGSVYYDTGPVSKYTKNSTPHGASGSVGIYLGITYHGVTNDSWVSDLESVDVPSSGWVNVDVLNLVKKGKDRVQFTVHVTVHNKNNKIIYLKSTVCGANLNNLVIGCD